MPHDGGMEAGQAVEHAQTLGGQPRKNAEWASWLDERALDRSTRHLGDIAEATSTKWRSGQRSGWATGYAAILP